MVDYLDFRAVFEGTVEYAKSDGEIVGVDTSAMKVARGKEAESRYEIDLYLWIDRNDGNKIAPLATSEVGLKIGKAYFEHLLNKPWSPDAD